LDGILESNGIIYVITTNYPEKLDKALLRPGRINFTIDFKKSDYHTIKEMLEYFYETKLPDTNEYGIKENEYTTSFVSGLCISYKNNINNSRNHQSKYYLEGLSKPSIITTLRR